MLQNDIDAFEKSFLNEDDPFAGLHDDTHLNSVASILKRFFHRWQDSKSWMVMWICQFKWQMKLYLTKTMLKNYWSSTQYNHRLPEPIFPKEYFDQIMIIAREYLCLDSTFIAHMCAGSLMQRIWQVIINYRPHVSFGFTTQLYEYVYYPDWTEISLSDLDNIQELTQQLGLTVSRTKWSKVIALCIWDDNITRNVEI